MKKIILLMFTILSINSFAGGDVATTTICQNKNYHLKINRKGSFFGKNHYKLKENKFFGEVLLNEGYEQDWSPTGEYEAERIALQEYKKPLDFYLLLLSENAVLVQTYESAVGYIGTYVQMKSSNEIIKFTGRECVQE